MDRELQIQAIVDFVSQHPESLASCVIRRETVETDEYPPGGQKQALQEKLAVLDEETLTGYYYLVK